MSSIFRRIRSPREPKDRDQDQTAPNARSFSTGTIPGSQHGHRRHRSDEIQNVIYTEPNNVVNSHRPDASRGENPPLPPRNRPASVGNAHQLKRQVSSDDDPYYVTPVDTLNRRGVVNPTSLSQGERFPVPTRSERKQMHMHEMTLSQRHVLSHRRAGSVGHVIDSSDYSTPWNLIKEREERDKENQVAPKPPPKPQRSSDRSKNKKTVVQQSVHSDDSDDIIPVMSPTPPLVHDRSQTNSPSSPTITAAENTSQGGSDDYDEPWDRKFRDFRMGAPGRVRSSRGRLEGEADGAGNSPLNPHPHRHSHHEIHHHHSHHHTPTQGREHSPPQPDVRPRIGAKSASEKIKRRSPPLPELRPRMYTRSTSDRTFNATREPEDNRGPSPVPPVSQSWAVGRGFRDFQKPHLPFEHILPSCELQPRASSVSNRRLPSPPMEPGDSQEQRRCSRPDSPPTTQIDVHLPLGEQT